MTLRALVIGTGFGARVVAPALAAAGAEVVDVVSARADVAGAIAHSAADLVSVHSPPFLHAEHVERAFDAGAAVLCDKPCTPSASETAALVAGAEASGSQHFVNFEFRYDPCRVELRRLVRHGAIGSIEHISWTHRTAGSTQPLRKHGWLFDRDRGGGWIGAWASHAVDTLHWLLGEPLAVESCRTRIDVVVRPDVDGNERACTAEDGLLARLVTPSGVAIDIDSTYAASDPAVPRLVVSGRDGTITSVGDRHLSIERGGVASTWEPESNGADHHVQPMHAWAIELVRTIVEARDPAGMPTLYDGLAVDRVLDALRAEA